MTGDWSTVLAVMKDIWWIASLPLTALATAGMFYLRSQFPTKQQHDEQTATLQQSIRELSVRAAATERQVLKLEGEVQSLPTRAEVQALGERIGRVEKEVATSTETTRGVEKTVAKIDTTLSLILKHLLEEKG